MSTKRFAYLVQLSIATSKGHLDGNIGAIFDTSDARVAEIEGNAEVATLELVGPMPRKLEFGGFRFKCGKGVGVGNG